MSAFVILSWDPVGRTLEYLHVNGGAGGIAERLVVSADVADDITATLAGHTLPRIADIEAEDDIVLIYELSQVRVTRCTVKAVGRPDDRKFELKDKERWVVVATVPAAALGVTDVALAGAANELEYLYAENLDPPGCWLNCAGGIAEWLAARRKILADAKTNGPGPSRAEAFKRFVNPYTFVPFPERIERPRPAVITCWDPNGCPGRSL